MPGFHGFAVFSYAHKRRSDKPISLDAQLSFRTGYHLNPGLAPHSISKGDRSDHGGLQRAGDDAPSLQQQHQKRSPKSPKSSKKVRFVDQVALIPSCRGDALDNSSISASIDEGTRQPCAVADDRVTSMPISERQGSVAGMRTMNVNGVVRLKVMISKKDLTELMSPKTTEKQAGAIVERMIAPLLSPQKSPTIPHCSQG